MRSKLLQNTRLLIAAGALVGTIGFAIGASAQGPRGGGRPGQMQGDTGRRGGQRDGARREARRDGGPRDGGRFMDDSTRINRQLTRLTEELTLTSAQQTQVRAILVEEQDQMKTLRDKEQAANTDDREARFTQMKAIRELNQRKIAGVLTAAQKTKFEQLRAEDQKRFGEGRGRRGPGGPPGGNSR
jgi:hypothetical protein